MEKKTLADYPELVKQCHPTKNKIDPKTLTHGSREKIWWLCKNGHEWQAQILNRTTNQSGCPDCYKNRITKN
ncbi:MAG: zinc-ribbon domain-containing protein [Nitrososphaerales archaeon]|nr:zinc-ribbon domain-containing protein [Nitrososphaerales archaeon]